MFSLKIFQRFNKKFNYKITQLKFRLYLKYYLRLSCLLREKVFCKVGANDGLTFDPCGKLLLNIKGWKGHLIEPIPFLYKRLLDNYKDKNRFSCHQLAIGKSRGEASIFCLTPDVKKKYPDLPYYWDQLASFSKGHIEKHFGDWVLPFIKTVKVKVLTLTDFCIDNSIEKIDFLHIDTEGHDLVVLDSLNFDSFKPEAILIEVQHLDPKSYSRVLEILNSSGFLFIFANRPNRDGDLLAFQDSSSFLLIRVLTNIMILIEIFLFPFSYFFKKLNFLLKKFMY